VTAPPDALSGDPTGRLAGPATGLAAVRRVRIHHLQAAKQRGQRWAMLTAYDAQVARHLDEAGIPVLLVGDSVGTTVLGRATTVGVSVAEMVLFGAAVAGAVRRALVVVDLPFGSYEAGPEQALATAVTIMARTGAGAVKLEGGRSRVSSVAALVDAGIPVMGHVGFTPQREHTLGGHRVQGRGVDGDRVLADAAALAGAGAFAVVLEMVPGAVAERVSRELPVPVIGIGAGPGTDAQVLVWTDLAGLTTGPVPSFVRRYAELGATLGEAAGRYAQEVAAGSFPGPGETFD